MRVSGRQQFELHLVKGKILGRRKGKEKGLKREEGETNRNGGRAIAYGKCIQRVNACMDGARGRPVITSIQEGGRRVHIRKGGGQGQFLLSI